MQIEIPYPPAKLSPNSGGNWRSKQAVMEKFRNDCYLIGKTNPATFNDGDIQMVMLANMRENADLDNLLASCKRGIDSLCKAWVVDDKRLNPIVLVRAGKGKKIILEFSQKTV
jgi:hypothetical protein